LPRPVVIADYDPTWPVLFQLEKARILGALAGQSASVEHIGSTAVPGLAAKPIIDILVGVSDLHTADACVPFLVALGYTYSREQEEAMPERRYLDRADADGSYHLHLVAIGGDFWRRHLAFRDYLRSHPQVAADYERLKRSLAERYRHDREGYTDAKTEFIRTVEEKARDGG